MQSPKKIVVIGPESTGKSTLSAALAASLRTVWVPEQARAYLESLGRLYEEADLRTIAHAQLEAEDAASRKANKLLICDTDLHVIRVWSEARYGRCHRAILQAIAARHYDAYLLTDIDMPWADDPLREHPNPRDRRYFYAQYRDALQNTGRPWTNIYGDKEERLARALTFIEALTR